MLKMNLRMIITVLIFVFLRCSEADDTPDPVITTGNTTTILQEIATDLNGYKIAFGDTQKIYMMNPDGSNVEELANGGPVSGYVSWSPDAKYVYFASAKGLAENAWEAFRVNTLTKELTKISNFNLDVRSLGVSPDGQKLAISVMTGNSNIGNNNDNLTQFSTNLYTIPMSIVESKIAEGNQIVMADLTSIQSSPNQAQFWYEELSWNYDASNPILAYTKTWRYDEDDVSYTHAYTIKPDGTSNTLISENKDQPIWSIDNSKLSFLDLSYYDFSDSTIKQITVSGINNEVSGGAISPINGNYIVFEIGDENRKGGIAKTTQNNNIGIQLSTSVNIYEPRWSPVPTN
jgi:Tol biopolymer transport system component